MDFSRIVSVITDGTPSMFGKESGFINLFTKHVGHPLLGFRCLGLHQEALCAKITFKSFDAIIKLVTKIVNFITARGLNKRKFENVLKEVNSVIRGLVMFNNVRWLSFGNVLQRFIECFDEIKMFLDEQNQIHEKLSDLECIARLMLFADFTQHLNKLNIKLQGDNPDTLPLEKLNLKVLEWLNLDDFEMQLVDFQSSTI